VGRGDLPHIFGKFSDKAAYLFFAAVMPLFMSPRFLKAHFYAKQQYQKCN
jgi:hypothetical protein